MRKVLGVLFCTLGLFPAFGAGTVRFDGVAVGGSNGGGAFNFTVQTGTAGIWSPGQQFRSFCVELDETIAGGNTYGARESDTAIAGGANTNLGDTLDIRSAYLFWTYMGPGNNYGLGLTAAQANGLQAAIWLIEEEIDQSNYRWTNHAGAGASQLADEFLSEAQIATGFAGLNPVNNNWAYNVAVLNLGTPDDFRYQDQLVIMPVPGAVLLGAIGLGVAGWVKRRMA